MKTMQFNQLELGQLFRLNPTGCERLRSIEQ